MKGKLSDRERASLDADVDEIWKNRYCARVAVMGDLENVVGKQLNAIAQLIQLFARPYALTTSGWVYVWLRRCMNGQMGLIDGWVDWWVHGLLSG